MKIKIKIGNAAFHDCDAEMNMPTTTPRRLSLTEFLGK